MQRKPSKTFMIPEILLYPVPLTEIQNGGLEPKQML